MSLEKAIKYGKEKRKDYAKIGQYAKSVSSHCRNHGVCDWCKENRLYKNKKRNMEMNKKLKELEVKDE